MQILITFVGLVAGAVAGSVATALADRFARPKDFLVGRSQCSHCKTTLRWLELIPILSWLVQRGQCRKCHWPIGIEVLIVELASATVGAIAVLQLGVTWVLLLLWLALIGLGALVITDWNDQQLPDRLMIATLPLLLLIGWFWPTIRLSHSSSALLGLLIGGGSLALLWLGTKGRGIGLGDVKLTALFGLSLGYPLILLQLFISFVFGGLFAGVLLLTGRARLGDGTRVAFGPFLIVGYLIALLFGRHLLIWYGLV